MTHSCIYRGRVRHRRFSPRPHSFEYSLFMLYLDLDELPGLFERYWLWSAQRRNLAWFRRADHLGDSERPLAECVRDFVQQHSGRRPRGPIRLLTHLRYFGHGFNPVSFYYCFDAQGERLEAIVAEVNNTPWGEQHCYLLPVDPQAEPGRVQSCSFDKDFHVSPFMGMDMRYDWRFSQPQQRLFLHLNNIENDEKLFDATLMLERRPINSATLAGVLLRYPMMTLRVVAAIYRQALRLWLKGIPVQPHPGKKEAPRAVKT